MMNGEREGDQPSELSGHRRAPASSGAGGGLLATNRVDMGADRGWTVMVFEIPSTPVLATEERGADQRKSSREEEREFGRRTGYSMRELLCLFIHAGALLLLSP